MIKVVTYGGWVKEQENRPAGDPVGEFSRWWDSIIHARVHTPSGIRRWLEREGYFESQPQLRGWLDVTEQEYRVGRGDLRLVEPSAAGEVKLDMLLRRTEAIESLLWALLGSAASDLGPDEVAQLKAEGEAARARWNGQVQVTAGDRVPEVVSGDEAVVIELGPEQDGFDWNVLAVQADYAQEAE